MWMRKSFQAFFALLLLLCTQLTLAATPNPHDVVQQAAGALIERLVKDRPAYKKDPQLLYDIVKQNIEPYVDFDGFAKGVMGQYYRQATDKQRTDFAATFRKSLIRTYANGLGAYDNQKFVVKPWVPGDDAKKAQIDMDIQTASNGNIPVTYQMVLTAQGDWKVKNVIINGMNLGLTFRNQFAANVEKSRGNLDQAIATFIPDAGAAKDK